MANCIACQGQILTHHYFLLQGDGRIDGGNEREKRYLCTDHPLDEIKRQVASLLVWAERREFGRVVMRSNPGLAETKLWSDERRFLLWKAEEDGEVESGSQKTGLIAVHLLPGEPRNEMLIERFLTHSNWTVDNAIA